MATNHLDAFRNLLGSDTVEVVGRPPAVPGQPAPQVTTVSPTPAASAPTPAPAPVTTPPATPETRLPPGVVLPQHARATGGKEDSLRELAKKKEELEGLLVKERADAEAKIRAAQEEAAKRLEAVEQRLSAFDYTATREFQEKFAEPELRTRSAAVAFVKAIKPEIDEAAFTNALDLPAAEFEAFLDAQGVVAKQKLVDLWADRKVIRTQANEAVKAAPTRIKALKEKEQEQALRAAEFEKTRRKDLGVQFALSLRDRVPGFEDRPGDPTYNQVVISRRALVAGAVAEGDLSDQSRELVVKGALFDEVAEENRQLRAKLEELKASAGNHRAARPFGLPTPTAPSGQQRRSTDHRSAHQNFLGNSS